MKRNYKKRTHNINYKKQQCYIVVSTVEELKEKIKEKKLYRANTYFNPQEGWILENA